MHRLKLSLIAALFAGSALIVGCGPQTNSNNEQQQALMYTQMYRNQYGVNSSITTYTAVQYVTITNTTTVNVTH